MHTTFITPAQLHEIHQQPDTAIFDLRYDLADHAWGQKSYLESHIPNATYLNLGKDLAGPHIAGKTSRHPLPDLETLTATFSNHGIDKQVQVIVHDDRGGAFAARMWWMLRWLGHEAVAVLNGGWQAWGAAGYATESGENTRPPRTFMPDIQSHLLIQPSEFMAEPEKYQLVDSRAPDRYRGENETLDPVAGHIPSAANYYYQQNHNEAFTLKDPATLKAQLSPLFEEANQQNKKIIFYCGSGVTATFNILVSQHLGLPPVHLYPGSWSEWITDPSHPIQTGPERGSL